MAKTKEQKRQEAIDRARRRLPIARDIWMRYQPGGESYIELAKRDKAHADKVADDTTKAFKKAAARAHTDLHGNPLN